VTAHHARHEQPRTVPHDASRRRRGRPGDPRATALVLAAALALLLTPWAALAQQQAAPAQPQQQAAPAGQGGGGSGGEPIEIVADSLTVAQEQRLATFAGNVDAVQGEIRLRSDRLLVYYDGAGEGEQPASGAGAGGQGIRRLEASGNVSLASPGQTASGDRGTYEVAAGQVALEGNVVLTRAGNVVRGAKLDSNLRTGVSTVTAAQPGASGKPDQRVRALFTPGGGAGAAAAGGRPAPAATPGTKKAP
jgi:lipopolysaccharide export system protein LptA